jgi:hypothetical protein
MCNISKKLDAESVVAYKVVRVQDDMFYSCFSGYPFKVGKVGRVGDDWRIPVWGHDYSTLLMKYLYNENMINRVSAFKDMYHAEILRDEGIRWGDFHGTYKVLKIVLKGDLMEGTGANIGGSKQFDKAVVYAGTEVVSIEEIEEIN